MLVRHYSQRMLNPFRGLMHVIETDGADAVTVDGIHWDLYVDNVELLQDAYRDGYQDISVPDIKFGSWSHEQGLIRAPLISTMNYDAIQAAGNVLLNAVQQLESALPFPAGDDLELWLLDQEGLPLALLDSQPVDSEPGRSALNQWIVGQRCRRRFQPGSSSDSPDFCYGEWLESRLNACAGKSMCLQWFIRNDAGASATGGFNVKPEWEGRQLPDSAFPEMLIRSNWDDPVMSDLIADYINWLSPCLLQLPQLCETSRARLERAAWAQATEVEALHAMYPDVIDREALKAALVQARIIRANIEVNEYEEDEGSTPPYYIEL
ncbi:MAG: hypothetical protein IME93_05360 [Proteobacteria bacterium]|nr:hypothetical protein [Pseudomonadota bacterium]